MKIQNNFFRVFKNSTDITNNLKTFGEEYTLSLNDTDHLDIGYRKDFHQMFFEIKTANTINCTITMQKWNGTAWVNEAIVDETNGFKKSGFIFLEQDSAQRLLHNSIDGYWYRLKVSATTSNIVLNGLGIVFNNLTDLKIEEPAIESFYPRGISSHIYSIISARDYIMRRINNSQADLFYNASINPLTGNEFIEARLLNAFDILDINELRDASTFYALHKIFSNRQDADNDVYLQKSEMYLKKFEDSFKLWTGRKLTIDIDDNGKEEEIDKINSIRTIKLMR